MKKSHILILVLLAGLLMSSLLLIGDLSTYVTIGEAKKKNNSTVSIICRIDTAKAITYNPIENPNYLEFSVVDSLGGKLKVIYRNTKPTDMERAERLVIKGKVDQSGEAFECSEILMKCPSKYNDDEKKLRSLQSSAK